MILFVGTCIYTKKGLNESFNFNYFIQLLFRGEICLLLDYVHVFMYSFNC